MKTGKSYIVAGLFEGKPFNAPNDITIDEKGRIYFSDPRYLGHEPIDQPVQAVYRIDTDGTVHRIITDAGKPNGVRCRPTRRRSTSSATTTAGSTSCDSARARRRRPKACTRCWSTTSTRTGNPSNPQGASSTMRTRRGAPARVRTAWWLTTRATSTWRCAASIAPASEYSRRTARSSRTSRRARDANQCRVRPRRGCETTLRHVGQQPLSDQGGQGWLSSAGEVTGARGVFRPAKSRCVIVRAGTRRMHGSPDAQRARIRPENDVVAFRAGRKVRVPHRVDIDQLHAEIAASTARRSMVQ